MRVDFVYDKACPNVKAARANLMRAFSQAGLSARWTEHQIGAAETPPHVRGFGSPTILVDGADVAGLAAGAEDCCRVYERGGAPAVELIAAALERTSASEQVAAGKTITAFGSVGKAPAKRSFWKGTAAILPGIGVALLPKLVCPLCWPAYAGILSAAGLTFLMEDRYLLPISAAFLSIALAALAWRAASRRGYGPLALGTAAAIAILVAKFALGNTPALYLSIAALVVAGLWNAWPRRLLAPNCRACHLPKSN